MSAMEHDVAFVAVSHMPHLLAFASVYQILDHLTGQTCLKFAAIGFRDFTRITSSHSAIWTSICMASKDGLPDLVGGLHAQLNVLKGISGTSNRPVLYRYLGEAKQTCDDRQANQSL